MLRATENDKSKTKLRATGVNSLVACRRATATSVDRCPWAPGGDGPTGISQSPGMVLSVRLYGAYNTYTDTDTELVLPLLVWD